jgi:hypothetical protein
LFAVLVDNADFACADAFVGADERLGGTFINRWNKSPPQRAFGSLCICIGLGAPSSLKVALQREV